MNIWINKWTSSPLVKRYIVNSVCFAQSIQTNRESVCSCCVVDVSYLSCSLLKCSMYIPQRTVNVKRVNSPYFHPAVQIMSEVLRYCLQGFDWRLKSWKLRVPMDLSSHWSTRWQWNTCSNKCLDRGGTRPLWHSTWLSEAIQSPSFCRMVRVRWFRFNEDQKEWSWFDIEHWNEVFQLRTDFLNV